MLCVHLEVGPTIGCLSECHTPSYGSGMWVHVRVGHFIAPHCVMPSLKAGWVGLYWVRKDIGLACAGFYCVLAWIVCTELPSAPRPQNSRPQPHYSPHNPIYRNQITNKFANKTTTNWPTNRLASKRTTRLGTLLKRPTQQICCGLSC